MAVFLIRTNYRNLAAQFVGDAGLVVVSGKLQAFVGQLIGHVGNGRIYVADVSGVRFRGAATCNVGNLCSAYVDFLRSFVQRNAGAAVSNAANTVQVFCQLDFQLAAHVIHTNVPIGEGTGCTAHDVHGVIQRLADDLAGIILPVVTGKFQAVIHGGYLVVALFIRIVDSGHFRFGQILFSYQTCRTGIDANICMGAGAIFTGRTC